MGKVSKTGKISKTLVKKRIRKETPLAVTPMIPNQILPLSDSIPSKTRLNQLSTMIATAPISRGQRRRAMKRARLESRKAFAAAALQAKKSADNISGFGVGLGNFDEMVEAIETQNKGLPDETPTTATEKKKKCKWLSGALKKSKKDKADQVDITRVQTLLNIPDFANDPLAAMEKHLLNQKNKRQEKEQKSKIGMDMS
jgi:hypothetical protein